MKKISKNLSYLGYLALSASPFLVSAQAQPPVNVGGVWNLLCTLFGWLFMGVMFVAVVYIVLAAYNYLTASGDGKKVEKANHMLLYAVIGVIVAVLARNIPKIAASIVGLDTSMPGVVLPSCIQ